MSRVTINDLNKALKFLAEKTGNCVSKEEAIKAGKESYLYIEYAARYGGYRLVNVRVKNGGHFGAFGQTGTEARISAREMQDKIYTLLEGIHNTKYNAQ